MGELGVWQRIREHKIIQWALGYLAAALALTHAEELIAHAYGWPESIGQILIAVLGIGLPVAVTLAWYHGHRASRHVTGAEASIIAILLLIGSGLLWALVRPHEPVVTQSVAEHAAAPTTSPAAPASVPVTPASTAAPFVAAPNSGKPRIAILPFENLSPDPKNAFFTDGLHEEIISTLSSRAPDLEVISRTTMMTYRGANKPVQEIARELGVTHVLEGSVRREGNTVLLTLQLINARIDQHIWSQDYPRRLKSEIALESEVAGQVASELSVELGVSLPQREEPTVNPDAYDLFLKARLARQQISIAQLVSRAEVQSITELLERAIRIDPKFAPARVDLAFHDLRLAAGLFCCTADYLRRAREQLDAAQGLIPGDRALAVAEAIYKYRADAETPLTPAVEAALTADGQDTVNFSVGELLFKQVGRFEDALTFSQRLRRLDPSNPVVLAAYARTLADLRRQQDSLHALDALSVHPGWETIVAQRAHFLYLYTGRADALSTERGALNRLSGTAGVLGEFLECQLLRFEHRYDDLRKFLKQSREDSYLYFGSTGVGAIPVAEVLGWNDLLMGDLSAAHQQSDAIKAFRVGHPETHYRAWYDKTLIAEARLFSGDSKGAVSMARQSLAARPRELDAGTWFAVAGYNARILAWAGAQDDAVQLLENLSNVQGGLAPGEITRDPLYTVPLAGNARYKALQVKLEAQMAATKLE